MERKEHKKRGMEGKQKWHCIAQQGKLKESEASIES